MFNETRCIDPNRLPIICEESPSDFAQTSNTHHYCQQPEMGRVKIPSNRADTLTRNIFQSATQNATVEQYAKTDQKYWKLNLVAHIEKREQEILETLRNRKQELLSKNTSDKVGFPVHLIDSELRTLKNKLMSGLRKEIVEASYY